ncbi:hypothetical protein SAMN04488057_107126 [Cyclobacterium lianum]|uniref:Uncharacterized protein n=1 Tax=Cyclobacterium lianum TaxID=388280 RepID=A0A1M7P8C5_9BACT|nr:hypothetical protein SAMN04488057_107126 [Cyclobacterium lianum]
MRQTGKSQATNEGIVTNMQAAGIFLAAGIIPADILLLKDNDNHMKSSMMYPSHTGMTIRHARFHVTIKEQIIDT